jgi:hypothetical protein
MEKLIDAKSVKFVLKRAGFQAEECDQCMGWTSPELGDPLTSEDKVIAELSPEEQGFLRCLIYGYEEKKEADPHRLRALYETFWGTVRILHNLPSNGLAVKEGKYIVPM